FVECSARGFLYEILFLLAVVWSIIVTDGIIFNGSQNRFDKTKAVYRSLRAIKTQPPQDKPIPHWADVFFAIPVTGWQFIVFSLLFAGPSFVFILWRAAQSV